MTNGIFFNGSSNFRNKRSYNTISYGISRMITAILLIAAHRCKDNSDATALLFLTIGTSLIEAIFYSVGLLFLILKLNS